MIYIPVEAQLLTIAVLFYVHDACLMLFVNEGIITRRGKKWAATLDKNGLLLRGKRLFIPNLLLLHAPVYRLAWHPEKIEQTQAWDWAADTVSYGWFAFCAYGMAIALFLVTPVVYFAYRSDIMLLWCLALIYYFSIAAGVGIYRDRAQFGLTGKKALTIFLECLLCPPLVLNVVRKLSLARAIRANLVASAFQVLEAGQWLALRGELVADIDAEIADTDAADRIAGLNQSREILTGMNRACP